jgi:spore maturation protein CgeB
MVGANIIDDVVESLCELDCEYRLLDLSHPGVPYETIIAEIESFKPLWLFTINHIGYIEPLIKYLDKANILHVSWYMDDPFRYLQPYHLSKNSILFVCDKFYLDKLKDAGFKRLYYLPGATNPNLFTECEVENEERERFACDISFVGNSGYNALSTYRRYCDWVGDEEAREVLESIVRIQMDNPTLHITDIIKEVLEFEEKGLPVPGENGDNVIVCLEFASMSLRRKKILESLKGFDLSIYGDKGWRELLDDWEGMRFCGPIDYKKELPKLYKASKINLNITKTQLKTTVNQRVFDVSSCGGFILTDYRRDLGELFDLGGEIQIYKDLADLREKVQYYLSHPEDRREFSNRARQRVLKEHTYRERLKRIIDVVMR